MTNHPVPTGLGHHSVFFSSLRQESHSLPFSLYKFMRFVKLEGGAASSRGHPSHAVTPGPEPRPCPQPCCPGPPLELCCPFSRCCKWLTADRSHGLSATREQVPACSAPAVSEQLREPSPCPARNSWASLYLFI